MRTIIDLPAEQLEALDVICERDRISRAEAVRRAVALLISDGASAGPSIAFGLWRGRGIDGLEYQARIRREWGEVFNRRGRPAAGRASRR
jgi:hypothetical protein